MTRYRDLHTGLPDDVAREWGYPRLVTYESIYEYHECGYCEGHFVGTEPLPESEWYWKPTAYNLGYALQPLKNSGSKLMEFVQKHGKDDQTHDWMGQ